MHIIVNLVSFIEKILNYNLLIYCKISVVLKNHEEIRGGGELISIIPDL